MISHHCTFLKIIQYFKTNLYKIYILITKALKYCDIRITLLSKFKFKKKNEKEKIKLSLTEHLRTKFCSHVHNLMQYFYK